jgi:hypothetical protein
MKRKIPAVGIVAVGVIALAAVSSLLRGQPAQQGVAAQPAADLIRLNVKFDGAAACSANNCHGAPARKQNGHSFSNEFVLWSGGMDPHASKTWADLSNDRGKGIAQKLKIPNATTSERCLNCHALSIPAPLQGEKYKLAEGVTCDACHGPSSKYLKPHQTVGWYEKQLAALHSDGLLKQFGLYNTLDLRLRAVRCTSCHLAIDPALVDAGHPQPNFELNYYSASYPDRHWEEETANFNRARIWAIGQQVALHDALVQLASRAGFQGTPGLKPAYEQAMATYSVFNQTLVTGAIAGNGSALTQQMQKVQQAYAGKQNAQLAQAATAAATADDALAGAVDAYQPTKPSTVKLLQAVAGLPNLARDFGIVGQSEEAYALYALYSAYADTAKPGDAAAVSDSIVNLVPDPDPTKQVDANTFNQNLAKVKPTLPKK